MLSLGRFLSSVSHVHCDLSSEQASEVCRVKGQGSRVEREERHMPIGIQICLKRGERVEKREEGILLKCKLTDGELG